MNRKRKITVSESAARSRVVPSDMETAYREMAADDARERDATEWSEGVIGDLASPHASRWSLMGRCRPGDATRCDRQANDASNRSLNRVQVVPTTSNVTRIYPCEALIEWSGGPRKAMADQIATVSKQRLKSKLATLSRGYSRSRPRYSRPTWSVIRVSPPSRIGCILKSAGMSTPKRKVFNRSFWQSLIAVLVGNAIYYGMYRYLPPRGQHQLYRIDWGLAVDFWICVICYFLLRMIP